VILVLDGLAGKFVDHRDEMPTLTTFEGRPITTVAPSTTATALTSITTGLTPGEHGLVGYRMEIGGEILNVLRWATASGDARRKHEPSRLQPFAPFMGQPVPVVTKADFERTAFTEAHLRGGRLVGWRAASSLAVTVGELLRAGEPLIYAYYDGIDKIAHERGFGAYYDAELRSADDVVAQVRAQLVDDAVLLVTADHGIPPQRRCPRRRRVEADPQPFGRGPLSLAARPGAADDLLAAARAATATWPGHEPPEMTRVAGRPVVQPAGGRTVRRRSVDAATRSASSTPPIAVHIRWSVDTGHSHLLRCSCRC
jgi:hypothetical protein